jgi:hypothetical protein
MVLCNQCTLMFWGNEHRHMKPILITVEGCNLIGWWHLYM